MWLVSATRLLLLSDGCLDFPSWFEERLFKWKGILFDPGSAVPLAARTIFFEDSTDDESSGFESEFAESVVPLQV